MAAVEPPLHAGPRVATDLDQELGLPSLVGHHRFRRQVKCRRTLALRGHLTATLDIHIAEGVSMDDCIFDQRKCRSPRRFSYFHWGSLKRSPTFNIHRCIGIDP